MCKANPTEKPSTMETSTFFIPGNEREALQWLIPALDRPLANMPLDEFLKAWNALSYLYGGLNPDEATDHGEEIATDRDGPVRFELIEPRLIAPYYARSGWPVVLAPLAAEAWRRYENDDMPEDALYCIEALWAGIEGRKTGETGLVSTPLKS